MEHWRRPSRTMTLLTEVLRMSNEILAHAQINEGEIAWFSDYHRHTYKYIGHAKKEDGSVSHEFHKFEVEGKYRPMLVLRKRTTDDDMSFVVLKFTGKINKYNIYLLKENGEPRSFGKFYGFSKDSYLILDPHEIKHPQELKQSVVKPTAIRRFDEFTFRGIVEEYVKHNQGLYF
jgi:hypothetical protein